MLNPKQNIFYKIKKNEKYKKSIFTLYFFLLK